MSEEYGQTWSRLELSTKKALTYRARWLNATKPPTTGVHAYVSRGKARIESLVDQSSISKKKLRVK